MISKIFPFVLVSVAFALVAVSCGPARHTTASSDKTPTSTNGKRVDPAAGKSQPDIVAKIDFASKIRPILETRCRPCHFQGGKMYTRLPFDRPQTIRSLGTRLFSRIKDNDEQALIRTFLAQAPDGTAAAQKPR